MKRVLVVLVCAFIVESCTQGQYEDDSFYGIIQSRPNDKVGIWSVGGRSVKVTERTHLEEDDGPLEVGACAEVEIEGEVAQEIESKPLNKCRN